MSFPFVASFTTTGNPISAARRITSFTNKVASPLPCASSGVLKLDSLTNPEPSSSVPSNPTAGSVTLNTALAPVPDRVKTVEPSGFVDSSKDSSSCGAGSGALGRVRPEAVSSCVAGAVGKPSDLYRSTSRSFSASMASKAAWFSTRACSIAIAFSSGVYPSRSMASSSWLISE